MKTDARRIRVEHERRIHDRGQCAAVGGDAVRIERAVAAVGHVQEAPLRIDRRHDGLAADHQRQVGQRRERSVGAVHAIAVDAPAEIGGMERSRPTGAPPPRRAARPNRASWSPASARRWSGRSAATRCRRGRSRRPGSPDGGRRCPRRRRPTRITDTSVSAGIGSAARAGVGSSVYRSSIDSRVDGGLPMRVAAGILRVTAGILRPSPITCLARVGARVRSCIRRSIYSDLHVGCRAPAAPRRREVSRRLPRRTSFDLDSRVHTLDPSSTQTVSPFLTRRSGTARARRFPTTGCSPRRSRRSRRTGSERARWPAARSPATQPRHRRPRRQAAPAGPATPLSPLRMRPPRRRAAGAA